MRKRVSLFIITLFCVALFSLIPCKDAKAEDRGPDFSSISASSSLDRKTLTLRTSVFLPTLPDRSKTTYGFTYQWEYYNGSSWVNLQNGNGVSGANSATCTVDATKYGPATAFRCYVKYGYQVPNDYMLLKDAYKIFFWRGIDDTGDSAWNQKLYDHIICEDMNSHFGSKVKITEESAACAIATAFSKEGNFGNYNTRGFYQSTNNTSRYESPDADAQKRYIERLYQFLLG